MKSFEYTIKDKAGIHARPAGVVVKCAKEFKSNIKIENKSKSADCKGIFGVMSLAAKCGEVIRITAEGPDEAEATKRLEDVIKENF